MKTNDRQDTWPSGSGPSGGTGLRVSTPAEPFTVAQGPGAPMAEGHTAQIRRHDQMMEAIGELAANVAHDFNNILTVIHGHASMLLLKFGPEGAHAKSVNEIRKSAERATNLVRQLQMLGRKQIVQFRDVDLDEVIRSVSALVRQLAGDSIKVEFHCAPQAPAILADRGMIEQVIVNLANNARETIPRGGRLVISSSVMTLGEYSLADVRAVQFGPFMRLTVSATGSDTGWVTPMRQFEPPLTNSESGKRTALGLATVYGIVKQHRGWIEIQGPTAWGTTFQVYFPVSQAACVRSAEPEAQSSNRSGVQHAIPSHA